MKNVMQATGCSNSHAAQLSAHRRSIMDMLVGCPLITTAEYDTAMNRTLACESLATLQKWYRNTVREIARREELVPVVAPVQYATAEQKEEIIKLTNRFEISRAEKTKVLMGINRLDYAEAQAVIGVLWGNIVARAGASPLPDGWSRRPEVAASYSSAA